MHQEVVTFERSQAYPEYTHEDILSQSHVASQNEVPKIRNTKTQCDSQFNSAAPISEHTETKKNTTMKKGTKKSSTHGFLRKCQPPAWQRFPGGSERQEREGRSARPRRRERSRRRSRMQPGAQERGRKIVQSFTPCGGKRQWCIGRNNGKCEHVKVWQRCQRR